MDFESHLDDAPSVKCQKSPPKPTSTVGNALNEILNPVLLLARGGNSSIHGTKETIVMK